MIWTPDDRNKRIVTHLHSHDQSYLVVGMGVGKTSSCLHALNEQFLDGAVRGALVVAPMRVANLTWPEEVRMWDDVSWMRVANLRTARGRDDFLHGRAQIYTINYESLPNFVKLAQQRLAIYNDLPYDVEIWDETTFAKNPTGKRVNKFRRTVPRAEKRWGLTGTPAPNGLLDVFAQVRLLDDGKRLGHAFDQFKRRFFRQADFMGYKWEIMPGSKETIEGCISDMTLTIEGGDWPVHFEDIELPLPEDLHKMYRKFERDLILELHGSEITAASAAALVSKLLQFTSGAMYDVEKKHHFAHNVKMDALAKIAKQHDTLLVAVNFQHEQKRIRERFPHAEFFMDAKTPSAQERLRDRWNAREVKMLVAHPQSVGHGLNLQHGGSHMVWTTLNYNADTYRQMIARLARRGQTETVTVYRLMCPGTVDDVVAESLEFKTGEEKRLMQTLRMLEAQARGEE